jgi:hypothetical protein
VSVIMPNNAVKRRNGQQTGDIDLHFAQVSSPVNTLAWFWFDVKGSVVEIERGSEKEVVVLDCFAVMGSGARFSCAEQRLELERVMYNGEIYLRPASVRGSETR